MSGMGSRLQMETKLPSQMTGVCLSAAIVENMAEFRPEMADSLPAEPPGQPQCRRRLERTKGSESDTLVVEVNALAVFTYLFLFFGCTSWLSGS